MKPVIALVGAAFFAAMPLPAPAQPALPAASLNLRLAAPIKTWDEAVPLGNGAMGVLLWGEGNVLRLSLDRGDLWDERPSQAFLQVRDRFNWATLQQLVASNRMDDFNAIGDANYDYNGPPTKLPAGRVELTLDESQTVESFELNLATAEGIARFTNGNTARLFVNAADVARPVALLRLQGPPLKDVRLQSPASVKKLGYPATLTGQAEGLRWFEQPAANGFSYAICAAWKRVDDSTLLAVTVATSQEGKSPRAVAEARVHAALKAGYEKLLARHADWWAQFWAHSSVNLPEPEILRHYYLVRYFYGAASRRGAPPMPLQGVWSADAGSLPPWKGDYHNDLNTQMTYLAYRASGDFDEGLCFLDYLWDRLPVFRKFARDFYSAPGAAVPGVMSLAGQPLGGWGQYSLSPTMGAWNAHLFYLHWRQTGDDRFLRTRAYPFCREIGLCLRALLKPDANGVLVLPLSSSPEIFDNSRRASLQPDSNYDLASMQMLFLALAEMADSVGDQLAAADWANAAKQLGAFHTRPDGTLLLDATTPLPGSHRHLSNLMALHPFNLITRDGGDRDRQIIAASLKDWDSKGTGAWCGYTFSWMSCLRARVGDPEAALRNLDIYVHAFILRNGFHANGDQTQSGFSGFTYRPFTLEGNFLAMQAVHEMLLQSWSPLPGQRDTEVLRVFPSMPWRWHEASFTDLRAEGGHRVSAKRENNATTWLRIVSGRDGLIRLRDNFGGREPNWSVPGVRKLGDDFTFVAKKGAVLEATLARPEGMPPAPADLAEPVVIQPRSAIRSNTLPMRIGADSDWLGQLTAPVETISLRQEPGREVCLLGQRSRGGRLVLTPDTCFFHGRLHLTGEVAPKYPGAELNGNRSWTRIEGLNQPGQQVVWPLWFPQAATLKVAIEMEVSASAAGASLEVGIGDSRRTVITHLSDGSVPQPWTIELPVTKTGLQELSVALRKIGTADNAGAIRRIVVTGPGVEAAVLVRSRWRAAAIHAHFNSSQLSPTENAARLWVMEVRPLPCEDSMYAPITTPFGYFGSTYEPDGTSGGVNFSMWSYGAGLKEPPVERLSHLLALGDPRLEFGRFDGEGHGVKPRGWNPFPGEKITSAVFALRLDPGDPYDTYTGYLLDPQNRQWKLYASGRKWHAAGSHERSLLPGAFVEVPGPPDVQRSAFISRGADFRGWCRDAQGGWHPLDQMEANDLKANELVQKTYELLPDGWFHLAMGGLEQYRYAHAKPIINSEIKPPLPDYLEPVRVAALDRMPVSVVVQDVAVTGNAATLKLVISAPPPGGKVTVFYGPTDELTFAERWAHQLEIGEKPPGPQTVQLPNSADARACRVLLRGNFGSVWSYSSPIWH